MLSNSLRIASLINASCAGSAGIRGSDSRSVDPRLPGQQFIPLRGRAALFAYGEDGGGGGEQQQHHETGHQLTQPARTRSGRVTVTGSAATLSATNACSDSFRPPCLCPLDSKTA
jgi:hypothetical protein